MNFRRFMLAPKLKTRHRIGSRDCFDRAETSFALRHRTVDDVADGSFALILGYFRDVCSSSNSDGTADVAGCLKRAKNGLAVSR
jgi:hypothetical protein